MPSATESMMGASGGSERRDVVMSLPILILPICPPMRLRYPATEDPASDMSSFHSPSSGGQVGSVRLRRMRIAPRALEGAATSGVC